MLTLERVSEVVETVKIVSGQQGPSGRTGCAVTLLAEGGSCEDRAPCSGPCGPARPYAGLNSPPSLCPSGTSKGGLFVERVPEDVVIYDTVLERALQPRADVLVRPWVPGAVRHERSVCCAPGSWHIATAAVGPGSNGQSLVPTATWSPEHRSVGLGLVTWVPASADLLLT